jgi:hypothetical protein
MISVPVKPQTKEISIDGEQFDGLLKKNKAEVNKAEWSAAKKDRDALIDRVAKALKIKPASRARVSNKKRVATTAEALQGKRSKKKTRKRPECVLVPEKTSERAIDI